MAEEKNVMSQELVDKEFTDWAENMGIEVSDEDRNENDEIVLANGKKLFSRAMKKGSAVVNADGNLVYTISDKSPEGYKGTDVEITLPPPRAFISGGKNDSNGMQRVLSVASGMTGKDTGWLVNLALPDFKFFMGIAGLFLID